MLFSYFPDLFKGNHCASPHACMKTYPHPTVPINTHVALQDEHGGGAELGEGVCDRPSDLGHLKQE